jgi:MFS family permease
MPHRCGRAHQTLERLLKNVELPNDIERSLLSVTSGKPRVPFGFRFVAPLALGSALNPINSTMIATAVVPIATNFHASVADAGWLIAGLYLASAIAQPTMGRLADLFGARRIYLISLFLVAAAGLLGRIAPSLSSLVVVRVLLGIGTSGAYPSAMRIFRVRADHLGCEPPRAAMGFLSLAALSTAAIGPLLGGVLTGAFGWHSIFLVNVPLALITALLVLLWTPKDQARRAGFGRVLRELDLGGIGLFAAFLLCLMIFLINLGRPIWVAGLGATAFGAALGVHSLRTKQPFIDVRMLASNGPLTLTYLRTGVLLMIVYCINYGFAQWLESAAGFTSSKAGLMMLPVSVVGALSSLAGARTNGIRAPILVSIGSSLLGCACLLFVDHATPAWIIAVVVTLFGIPQGLFSTATQAAIYIQAPADAIGTAAGFQRTAGYIGAIAATSLLALMYGQRATDHGFHSLAVVLGVLSASLLVVTIFDRTLPRGRVG